MPTTVKGKRAVPGPAKAPADDPRVDDLDNWARQMDAWLKKLYKWIVAVHGTVHPHNFNEPVPKPPDPPPYPPK